MHAALIRLTSPIRRTVDHVQAAAPFALRTSVPENCLQKSAHQWVRHQLPGLGLRNEQSTDKKWMIGNLDDSDLAVKISARNDQAAVFSQRV